jgi:hypothetical protein
MVGIPLERENKMKKALFACESHGKGKEETCQHSIGSADSTLKFSD